MSDNLTSLLQEKIAKQVNVGDKVVINRNPAYGGVLPGFKGTVRDFGTTGANIEVDGKAYYFFYDEFEKLSLETKQQEPPMKDSDDPLHLTKHYRVADAMQPWDIIDAWELDYYEGNVLKYLLRAKHKGQQRDDYTKAIHYLQKRIKMLDEEAS